MSFTIRERETENDMENFFRSCFETSKNTNDVHYTSLKKGHPEKSDDEIFEMFKEEITESFDFERPDCKIFMIDGENGEFAGYIWVAIREGQDIWDFERPLWIYDISVQPEFRRKGLGKRLLERAESFAKELNRNIGLFVHVRNTGAIDLYQKNGYEIKCIPISKEPVTQDPRQQMDHITIIERIAKDEAVLQAIGIRKFRQLVEFTTDAPENSILEKYHEYWGKNYKDDGKHTIFVAESESEDIAGFIWVGESFFNQEIAMIYDFTVHTDYRQRNLEKILFMSAENWTKMNNFSRLYMLLHSKDDITLETCHDLGLKEPGYFMQKRLK